MLRRWQGALLTLALIIICISAAVVNAKRGSDQLGNNVDLDQLVADDDLEYHELDHLPPEEEEGPYDDGIGMNEWNGKHDGFKTREEEYAWMEQERAFFDAADKDGDGGLTMDEYKAAMIEDMQRYYEQEGNEQKLTAEDDAHVQEMADHFRDEDLNSDGKISITEWVALAFHEDAQEARYRDGHAEHELTEADLAEHRAEAEREFALFDKDGDGRLTLEEAMELVRGDTEIGVGEDKVEESELREMAGEVLSEMDRDADGAVTKEEFVKAHGPDDPQGAEADARLMRAEQWANTKRAMELQDVGYEHPPAHAGLGWMAFRDERGQVRRPAEGTPAPAPGEAA